MGTLIGVAVVVLFLIGLAMYCQNKLLRGLDKLTPAERAAVLASLDDPEGWFAIDHASPDEIRSDND